MLTTYLVSGMTCNRCAAHIAEEVSEIAGVAGVNVSCEEAMMTVESAERVPYDSIIEAVAEAGNYTVVEA